MQNLGRTLQTDSDSETILQAYAAYGREFLNHLRGMYAFALYDKARQRLILARDRLGIKPLFYTRLPDRIAFASEIKALLPILPEHPWFAETDIPLFLSAGELCARKDFSTLLRAFARLRAQRRCRLIILGRGSERDKLLALAEELGVSRDFALPGFVTQPYAYMARADLFVIVAWWVRGERRLIRAMLIAACLGVLLGVIRKADWSQLEPVLQGVRYEPVQSALGLGFTHR